MEAILNNRYRIQEEIGQGGMGTIYRAHDKTLDRYVAIKILTKCGFDTKDRARLLSEARTIARLNHPNIVSVFDAGEADLEGFQGAPFRETSLPGFVPFIVMEYVKGFNLYDQPPESIDEIVAVAQQLCAALDHAHKNGIIHRDLKPENVIMTTNPRTGISNTAKLMDFGLARSVSSRFTDDGDIVGTVFYLAPEHASGELIDHRSDLYSLGVMLYELTTGELPFVADDPVAVISQHLHAPIVPPRVKQPEIYPSLEALILQLLDKDPSERPDSAIDVLTILEQLQPRDSAEILGLDDEPSLLNRIVRGRIVGRELELSQGKSLWNTSVASGGQSLLISGEPGIGKTRLLQEISAQAAVSGGHVFVGKCHADRNLPYAPFGQIVRQVFRRNPDTSKRLPEFVLADLISLAPGLRTSYPDVQLNPTLDPQTEQYRLFENFVAFTKMLSEEVPILIAVDDVHWADSGTLALLLHLARRTLRQRVLLLATYREIEMSGTRPINEVLMELIRERLATRIKLSRLNKSQTREMLTNLFDEEITPEFLDAIYQKTEGNPFFVEEVCKTLVDSGKLFYDGSQWKRPNIDELEIPQSVRDAIQSRINRLPEDVRRTLQVAALLGREFDFGILAESSDLDEDAIIDALETAEKDQLIEAVVGHNSERFSFAHALIPATLEEGIHALRRRRIHHRIASVMENCYPDNYPALAHHFHKAGEFEQAFKNYIKAGEAADKTYANKEAENYYISALKLSENEVEHARLLAEIGIMQNRQGRHHKAIESWRQGIAHYRTLGNQDQIAELFARMGSAARLSGDTPGCLSLRLEGLDIVKDAPDSPGLAKLLSSTASAYHLNGRWEKGQSLALRALKMAERLEAVEIQADTLNTIAFFPNTLLDDKFTFLRNAIVLSENAGLWRVAARAHNNIALQYGFSRGDIPQAINHLEKAAELAHKMGIADRELFFSSSAATWNLTLGNLKEVEEAITKLHELKETAQVTGVSDWMLRNAEASLLMYQGHLNQSSEKFKSIQAETRATGEIQILSHVDIRLGEILIELGDLAAAREVLAEAIEIGDKGAVWGGVWPRFTLAKVCTRDNSLEEIQSLCDEARKVEKKWGNRFFDTCWRKGIEALLGLTEKRWDQGWTAYKESLEMINKTGFKWMAAQLQRDWAETHILRGEGGDRERARGLLVNALGLFDEIGSVGFVEMVKNQISEIELS